MGNSFFSALCGLTEERMTILEMKNRRASLAEEMKALASKVASEGRAYTDEEDKRFTSLDAEIADLGGKISAMEREEKASGLTNTLPVGNRDENGGAAKKGLFNVVRANGQVSVRLNNEALTVTDQGAAIAPEEFVADLEREVAKSAVVYPRVTKIPVTGAGSLGLPYESADVSDAEWTSEVPESEISEDSTWKFGKRSLAPTDLTKLIKISKKLLATSALPIDSMAKERIAEKFTAAYENTILNGTGSSQPLGIFVASDNGIPTSRDVECSSSLAISADDIVNMYMSLRPAYRKSAVWVLNTAVLKDVMKLKDNNGQYLWHESLRVGEPSTLMGLPVLESEFAPAGSGDSGAYAAGDYVMVLGDLSHYKFAYWKGLDVTVATEKFAGTNQIGIYGHSLADGQPTLPAAFSRLKIKA